MKNAWGFWDRLAYATLWIAAVIVAADTALKGSQRLAPHFDWLLENRLWSYAPLILMTLSGVVFLGKQLGWRWVTSPPTAPAAPVAPVVPPLTVFRSTQNKLFKGETVELDGREFIKCTFQDCTFLYQGGAYRCVECTIHNDCRIMTTNTIVMNTLGLASQFAPLGLLTTLARVNIPLGDRAPG
jgi:hypothetical protein